MITCSAPAVTNGRIRPGSRVYKHEDTVDVTCSEGFDLIGPAQVTCGPDGQWQALPECRPKRITGTLKVCVCVCVCVYIYIYIYVYMYNLRNKYGTFAYWIQLGSLTGKCGPAPSHPHAFPGDRFSSLREYPSGARVLYKCSMGYSRVGGRTSIRCQNGQWTNPQLRCESTPQDS